MPKLTAKQQEVCDLLHCHCGACGMAITQDGHCGCEDCRVHPVGRLDKDLRSKYLRKLQSMARHVETLWKQRDEARAALAAFNEKEGE